MADRENNRVQVFTVDGEFIDQWADFKCPMGVHIDTEQRVYVTDQVPRLSILTLDGELLARGRTFEYAHQVYTDSQGNITARILPTSASKNWPGSGNRRLKTFYPNRHCERYPNRHCERSVAISLG